ncbi:hypothetical protein [Lacipirellula limnantheis]|uniref:DUF1570 domain-containing protein n=1 Tax=Lacipirellula limnantheis TaxID=2528024 RepID=A0A517U5I6_9BACT|nr:hypothetical protein [Lacipirellula limnantheis]QDT75891.1 hypothetical protein I41_51350 [Lacipirellula limnantheis]
MPAPRFRRCLFFLIAACVALVAAPVSAAESGPKLGSLLFVPSDVYNSAGPATEPSPAAKAAAAAAFEQARTAVAAGEVSQALQHACRAVALDPNHDDARRLLGYQRVGDQWAGKYAQHMLKAGHLWSREHGWIKADHAAKYDQGLRPWGQKWITVAEDAERHADIEHGWTVRTDHFQVVTNVDRAAAADLAIRLETYYQLWRQLFGELALTPAELQARLDGKETDGFLRRPMKVVYHRNRDQYNDALIRRQPQIAMTNGIYFDRERESHFFAGDDQDPGTIAHEAVHQFFYESAPKPTRNLAAAANAWAVEGAACYFETLKEQLTDVGLAYTVGTPDAGRVQAARHRRIVDNFYVPLAELDALGVTDLQQRADLAPLYSQSAGLASFFIDGREGEYRRPFRELLRLIYAGRDEAGSLPELVGRSAGELDREYQQFMESLPVTAVLAP